jgi:O-succinylbenzoate synthase
MLYGCDFQPYQRYFKKPLQTLQGTLTIREGIIIYLQDGQGNRAAGEIAPLTWFGSESLAQALAFCQGLGGRISESEIFQIPESLSACQFAFASAWRELKEPIQPLEVSNFSYLLPAGRAALSQLAQQSPQRCYKWKIGVEDIGTEIGIFREILHLLPPFAQLRLDANGGLDHSTARLWLTECDRSNRVEFLEQPLGVSELGAMQQLSREFFTPLALDESVATYRQLQDCYAQGWRGIFVIKAAIMGYPHKIKDFCQEKQLDTVFSSALETTVGRKAALRLAQEVMLKERALGFGVEHFFAD